MLGAYDLLLLMDVIEHIDDDLEFVKVSLQHLKPDGLVVINVPAHMTCYSQYDEVAGHKRRYGVADIKSLFRQARLKPISIAQWGLFLLPALLLRKLILRLTPPEHTIRVGFVPANPLLHSILIGLQDLETKIPFSLPLELDGYRLIKRYPFYLLNAHRQLPACGRTPYVGRVYLNGAADRTSENVLAAGRSFPSVIAADFCPSLYPVNFAWGFVRSIHR